MILDSTLRYRARLRMLIPEGKDTVHISKSRFTYYNQICLKSGSNGILSLDNNAFK